MSLTPDQLERFVADLAAKPERWRHLIRHADDARVHEQIWSDEHVNAWLICWSEDQDTGYHDHDVSAAAIVVISGKVREDRVAAQRPGQHTVSWAPAASSRSRRRRFTACCTPARAPAVTIHAYSPPLASMGAYRTGPDGTLQRVAQPTDHSLQEPALA